MEKIGLSLAGGGMKAYAQLGVLKYLAEIKLQPTGFSGTSMGAVIGALAALDLPYSKIEEIMFSVEKQIIDEKIFSLTNTQFIPLIKKDTTGLLDDRKFIDLITTELEKLNVKNLTDLVHPFVCPAVDLISGRVVLFTNRPKAFNTTKEYVIHSDTPLITALHASCAIPLVFQPVEYENYQLVDGGISLNTPVAPLKQLGFETILSVTMGIKNNFAVREKMVDIASRVIEIMVNEADEKMIRLATLNLNAFNPKINLFSFGKGQNALKLGYQIASAHHQELLALAKDN